MHLPSLVDETPQGYIRMKMGTPAGSPSGMCGILSYPVRPLKSLDNSVSGTPPPGAELINLASGNTASTGNAATVASTSAPTLAMGLVGGLLLALSM